MQLIKVDKARYRKHLMFVIVGAIAALIVGSLSISQTLIAVFPDPQGDHFHWNLIGVVATSILIGFILNKFRGHDFMTEVTYVWDLKQILNKITRRMAKIKIAAEKGDVDAMTAMQYSYSGSRLLWELDDNAIVMEELAVAQLELDKLAEKFNLDVSADNFSVELLNKF
jgi:hypothetical protein